MKLANIAAFVLLSIPVPAAAGQKIKQFMSPSGVPVNYVKCNRNGGNCMNSASKHCKGSYQVLGSESHAGGLLADVMPGPITWYSMTFLCGKSDGKMPRFTFQGGQWQMPTIVIPRTIRTTCTTSFGTTNCTTY